MDTGLVVQMTTMLAARTQGLAQIAIMKRQHQMEMDLIAMLSEVARAAPPPGQGRLIDRAA